eukprot:1161280-Pelagomonas_calceolata.AAC.12
MEERMGGRCRLQRRPSHTETTCTLCIVCQSGFRVAAKLTCQARQRPAGKHRMGQLPQQPQPHAAPPQCYPAPVHRYKHARMHANRSKIGPCIGLSCVLNAGTVELPGARSK